MIDPTPAATAALKSNFAINFAKGLAAKLAVKKQDLLGTFNDYLDRAYEQHRQLKSVVLRDQAYYLNDLYVPLRLRAVAANDAKSEVVVDQFPSKLFEKHRCVAVVDTAGMGKSTLSRYIFTQCVSGGTTYVPFLIDLRALSDKRRIETALAESLCDVASVPDPWKFKLVTHLADSKYTVLLLDGYDEVSDVNRAEVSRDIQALVAKSKCLVLMTSRQVGGLDGFAAFTPFAIQPLARSESHELIRKYAKASARVEIGEQLIAEISKPINAQIGEFLRNPLLTSLLFAAYEYKHEIPLKKTSFYGQVFEALFDLHDLTKPGGQLNRQKHSRLDRTDFGFVIRKFSTITFRDQKFDYSIDEMLNVYLPQVKKALPAIPFNADGLARDLIETVPLMVMEGTKYRWAHRSLQEYFVACQVCQDESTDRAKVLSDMARSKRAASYSHILDLCAELAPNDWRQSVLRMFLESWRDHRNKTLARFGPTGIPRPLVDERAALTCIFNFVVLADRELPPGDGSVLKSVEVSKWIDRAHEALAKAGQREHAAVGVGLGLSNPVAMPFVQPSQAYAVLSSKLAAMDLFGRTTASALIAYQRLYEKLGLAAEASNAEDNGQVICSPEDFEQFNRLMGRNGHRMVVWKKADAALAVLDSERASLSQANREQGGW